jgi:Leucine-rich repeat (LRR) protein
MSLKLDGVVVGIQNGENKVRIDLSSANLTEFPRELFAVADTLEVLNLGNNSISSLPVDIGCFKKLKILFFGQNVFETIPSVLGELRSLTMISFKSNKVSVIEDGALGPTISWLILSDNLISGVDFHHPSLFLLIEARIYPLF